MSESQLIGLLRKAVNSIRRRSVVNERLQLMLRQPRRRLQLRRPIEKLIQSQSLKSMTT